VARWMTCLSLWLALLAPSALNAQISEIIDSTADGGFLAPAIAVDSSGNVYVTASPADKAFKITPGLSTSVIIDSTGDAGGNGLDDPEGIAVDASGNVYVTGSASDNAFRITPEGSVTQIIDSTGDAGGNGLNEPVAITVDSNGNVYLTGALSDNAFKIATPGTCSTGGTPCTITEIIDSTGDGGGNGLDTANDLAVDASGNVYVVGLFSDNAFKITLGGPPVPALGPVGIALLLAALGATAYWRLRDSPSSA